MRQSPARDGQMPRKKKKAREAKIFFWHVTEEPVMWRKNPSRAGQLSRMRLCDPHATCACPQVIFLHTQLLFHMCERSTSKENAKRLSKDLHRSAFKALNERKIYTL